MPKGELAIPPNLPTSQGYIPPNPRPTSPDLAARSETESVLTAAALAVADWVATDSSPRKTVTNSDAWAEKMTELSLSARPTGLRSSKEAEEEVANQLLVNAHSQIQTAI